MAQTVCIALNSPDRERLEAIVADRDRPHKHVQRGRLILQSAGTLPVQQVAEAVDISRPMAWRWQ